MGGSSRPFGSRRGFGTAAGFILAAVAAFPGGCAAPRGSHVWKEIRERYVVGFLERNPITSTYLGGDGYDERLTTVNERLPDVTAQARAEHAAFYRGVLAEIDAVDRSSLAPDDAIDLDLARAQIRFLLRLSEEIRHHQRSLDTYTVAPFRGVDWQIQQMAGLEEGRRGTPREWEQVARRVRAIPAFLDAARANLEEGIRDANTPDARMVRIDGLDSTAGNVRYFRDTLPSLARDHLRGDGNQARLTREMEEAGRAAAAAFEAFHRFLEEAYSRQGAEDRFAAGEAEYSWRLRNNLMLDPGDTPAALFEYGHARVTESHGLLIDVAREVAARRRLDLPWDGRAAALRSVRRVMDDLARERPRSDDEMFALYRKKALELVEYARRGAMFDLPAEYRLEIVETPDVLRGTLEAAYYPAPPFKETGIGRFYLTASRGDVGVLEENNVHAVADLCAHEGFPGHDWHHRFMRARARSISGVRWLLPGAVEDSSSMWQDSLAAEGWALYAEDLMAQPAPGAPHGFYTPEERLYQLKWQVLRDARVHIDTGLHTGRLGFDEAVAYYLDNVELLPDACSSGTPDPLRQAACASARRAVYRYSKWPTQAITYHLGKRAILDLRDRSRAAEGDRFSLRRFHERFMAEGPIPVGAFAARLLAAPAGG